ncbi:major histocompatibility complex class I-related gene protein-like isoform X1 [Rhinatrema bivittatum]|uniref:major histocompatibility complex class I-related gene protein-like isoform X1 n=1 Tax=Rhinatrema bivittatum TaxID=194408 RepID=UPI00112E0570|nr:major histocompatibility complex class I-related gene protein-like isoform X1 [Rhinatrema bivittatum]
MYPLLLLLLLSSLCARGVLSGVHTYQVMQGCNVTEHNTTVGFYRSAFDMENFLHINTTSMNWTAEMPQAEAEVEARNANWTITQQELKNLDMFCDYAKYLASFANQTLQRKEKPRVRVTERRLSNVTMSVYCRAYGFHPGLIRMTWLKDGAETQARLAPEDVLPSPDGTYQAFVYLFIVSETPAKGHQDGTGPWPPTPKPYSERLGTLKTESTEDGAITGAGERHGNSTAGPVHGRHHRRGRSCRGFCVCPDAGAGQLAEEEENGSLRRDVFQHLNLL